MILLYYFFAKVFWNKLVKKKHSECWRKGNTVLPKGFRHLIRNWFNFFFLIMIRSAFRFSKIHRRRTYYDDHNLEFDYSTQLFCNGLCHRIVLRLLLVRHDYICAITVCAWLCQWFRYQLWHDKRRHILKYLHMNFVNYIFSLFKTKCRPHHITEVWIFSESKMQKLMRQN